MYRDSAPIATVPDLTVVVPILNERDNLEPLLTAIITAMTSNFFLSNIFTYLVG